MQGLVAHGRRSLAVRCSAEPAQPSMSGKGKSAVVIGGTGRLGASTASVLLKTFPELKVTLASRNQESFESAVQLRPELKGTSFQKCDITDAASIEAALKGADLVIHAAGPFQRSTNHLVLEKAIELKTPYLDVCDDMEYSERSKEMFHEKATAAGVPAIISGGIYPGTSNVMAAHIISIAKKEYDEDWQYCTPEAGEGVSPTLLRYSYYTAGSGGAGKTILETSMLLAGEECIVYRDGELFKLPPLSNRREVDFGEGMGRKGTYLYNLPEVASAKKYLGVTGCSARFGTDPPFWNWGMFLLARLVPRSLLNNRKWVESMASLLYPMVAALDKVVGETVAMKVEVDLEKGQNSCGLFVHSKLSESMGYSVVGFAAAILAGGTAPGVWYPEQKEALADRRAFLRFASTGCKRFDLNKSAWSLESEPIQIGGLIYW